MLDTIESKARKSKAAPKPSRICIKCGRTKELDGYYSNRDWEEQLGKDIWCKECVGKCADRETIKEYYWENHRDWDERVWQAAIKKAEKLLADNAMYQKSGEDRRKMLLDRLAAQQVPTVSTPYYKYVDNSKSGCNSYAEAKAKGQVSAEADENEKVYDEFFNGYFTKRDLAYLETYYKRLEEDFTFDNENLRDYAKKCARASLQADKAQDDYAAGRCSFADVKDALAQFDMLSKSANFAACKRKAGDNSGLTSYSELSYKLETTGHTMQRQVKWDEDDVDRVINHFRHLAAAMNFDSI